MYKTHGNYGYITDPNHRFFGVIFTNLAAPPWVMGGIWWDHVGPKYESIVGNEAVMEHKHRFPEETESRNDEKPWGPMWKRVRK